MVGAGGVDCGGEVWVCKGGEVAEGGLEVVLDLRGAGDGLSWVWNAGKLPGREQAF